MTNSRHFQTFKDVRCETRIHIESFKRSLVKNTDLFGRAFEYCMKRHMQDSMNIRHIRILHEKAHGVYQHLS